MFFFRAVLIIGLVSLLASAGLLFFGSITEYEEFRGGYAVLSTDASVNDRTLVFLLNDQHDIVSLFINRTNDRIRRA